MKTSCVAMLMAASVGFAQSSSDSGALSSSQGGPAGPEKTHTLFMGTDISVQVENAFRRVREVSRSSWVVSVDGRPEFIPTERRALNLRVDKSLKLADTAATIANLKSERAYTMRSDPRTKAMRNQMHLSAYATERAQWAEAELMRAQKEGVAGGAGPEAERRIDRALIDMADATDFATENPAVLQQTHGAIAEEELKEENYDALEISFELSAARALKNPYMIIVALIRERGAQEGMKRNWIYAQELNEVDETPRRIQLKRGGMPIGYELERVDVHIYERGTELATNLSSKRVELTRDEAFQYLVIEHIGSNKGKTVPVSPALAAVTSEWRERLREGKGQQVYFVKVSKDGFVTEAFEDERYSKKVSDPVFGEMLKRVWFKPALEKGKPVDSQTALDLTKILH